MKYIYETQDFLKQAYENGGCFCTHGFIAQVCYSQAQGQYYFVKLARKMKGAKIGFAKRGFVNKIDSETAHRWIVDGLKDNSVFAF